jgi:hypothetical protein
VGGYGVEGAIACEKLIKEISAKRYKSHRAVFGEHEVPTYRPWGKRKYIQYKYETRHVRLFAF